MIAKILDRPATRRDLDGLSAGVVGEILAGQLHVSPRPASPHALASSTAGIDIGGPFHRKRGEGGPGGWWILDEPELELGDDILVPDLAGWRRERMPIIADVAAFTLAPDWVCEVVSPSTGRVDRVVKMPIYARAGVGHLWLVDPIEQYVEVFALASGQWLLLKVHGGDEKMHAAPFDTLEIDLARWWERGER